MYAVLEKVESILTHCLRDANNPKFTANTVHVHHTSTFTATKTRDTPYQRLLAVDKNTNSVVFYDPMNCTCFQLQPSQLPH